MKKWFFMALLAAMTFGFVYAEIPDPGGKVSNVSATTFEAPLFVAASVADTQVMTKVSTFPAELGVLDLKSKAASGVFQDSRDYTNSHLLKDLLYALGMGVVAALVALLFTLSLAPFVLDYKSTTTPKLTTAISVDSVGKPSQAYRAKARTIDQC